MAIEAHFHCPECGKEHVGVLLTPLEERSLRTLQESMSLLSESQESPPCCGEETELREILYRFDEPGALPLQYDPDRKAVTYCGVEIESEEHLQAEAGRPYSLPDLHRIKLAEGADPYSPSPGVVTIKLERAEPQYLSEQLEKAERLMEEQGAGGDGVIGPVNWRELSGYRTWLGGEADRITDGSVTVVNVIDTETLMQAIESSAESQGMKTSREDQRLQVEKDEIKLNYDVRQVIDLTVEKPLSLAEAGKWVGFTHARSIDCMQETLRILRGQGASIEVKEAGMIEVSIEGENPTSAEVNLLSIARKSEYIPEATARQIERMISTMEESRRGGLRLGAKKPCGCTPLLTLVLRPQEWVEEIRKSSQSGIDVLSKPAFEGIAKVLVEDCPHSLAYVYKEHLKETQSGEEELFKEAEQNLKETLLDLQGRSFQSIDEEVHAVAWLGHNASTVMLDKDMLRGLDANNPRVREGVKQLQAISASRDMVVLFDPKADQETIALQLAGLKQELKDSPYDLDPMVYTESFKRQGDKAGKFTVSQLPNRALF